MRWTEGSLTGRITLNREGGYIIVRGAIMGKSRNLVHLVNF